MAQPARAQYGWQADGSVPTLEPQEVIMPGKVPQQPNVKKKGKSIKEKRAAKKLKTAGSS